MNRLTAERRAAIVRALAEGNSIRATARLTDTAKATVLKLLVELGEFCSVYQDYAHRNLKSHRVEADGIWSFVGANQKNATRGTQGDLWTYTAICSESKLMVSWLVGARDHANTFAFMKDVVLRLANRVQLTTDGLGWYVAAVEAAFGWNGVDFTQIIKTYETPLDESLRDAQRRYSPAVCTGANRTAVMGNPDEDKISTSYVERQNLNMRMQMRRFTRLTNGFSKKAENHAHAVSLYFMFYNYCQPHQTLTKDAKGIRTTPAMAAGLTDHVWKVEEILERTDPKRLLHSN